MAKDVLKNYKTHDGEVGDVDEMRAAAEKLAQQLMAGTVPVTPPKAKPKKDAPKKEKFDILDAFQNLMKSED